MNRREFALGNKIRGHEMGLVGSLFVAAFPGGMILPFYVYLFGAGVVWEAIGIVVCMTIVWSFASYRLMRYSKRHQSICTIPGYLKHRFCDEKEYLRVISSCQIVILSIIIMSLLIKELGLIMFETFGLDSTITEFWTCNIISAYICIFGYKAIVKTAPYKAAYMMAVIILISIVILKDVGFLTLIQNMMAIDVTGSVSEYMNILFHNGRPLVAEDYISLLSMGLLASGMPFLLTAFFSAENSDKINRGKIVMIVFLQLFFASAAVMGGISRGYLYPHKMTNSLAKYISLFYHKLASEGSLGKVMGYMLISLIVLAVLITLEGSLSIAMMIVYDDIIRGGRLIRIKKKNERLYIVLVTFLIGLSCFIVSECIEDFSINVIVVFIAALGCSVAPAVLLSLMWKRMTKYGAIAGMIGGMLAVPLLKYAPFFGEMGNKKTLCDILGINSVVPAMLASFLIIILVSLITPKPSAQVQEEFDDVKHRMT